MGTATVNVVYFCACCATLKIVLAILPNVFSSIYEAAAVGLFSIIIAEIFYPFFKSKYYKARVVPYNKAVVITGCDTGFGHELAKRLDSKGFQVFASCLNPSGEGANKLRKETSERLQIVGLDVTDDESVKKFLAYVQNNLGDSELWAVVNNAGVYKGFDIALTSVEDFRKSFDTNTLGIVRVTKAFLPLLIRDKGRVVTVTSLSGRISSSRTGAYCMSKFASRAFCECLRQEVTQWGVKVIEIEPELFKTAICNTDAVLAMYDSALKDADVQILNHFKERYFTETRKQIVKHIELGSSKIFKVVDSLEDAVSLLEPCRIYKPRRNAVSCVAFTLAERLPKPLVDEAIRFVVKGLRRLSRHK